VHTFDLLSDVVAVGEEQPGLDPNDHAVLVRVEPVVAIHVEPRIPRRRQPCDMRA
jgi:hypothetical protein